MKKIALSCIYLFFVSAVLAQVSKEEKQALIDLYNTTNGADWNTKWDLESPISSWHGLTVESGKVTAINLMFNNLQGPLPASLGNLKNLKTLELSFNPISGNLPATLGNLKNLEVLAINGADLSGFIPEGLGTLLNLRELHLSSNQLTGTVPESLGGLPEIEVFNVFDNNLYGTLPRGLATARHLRELMVAENNFNNPDDFSVILLSNSGATLKLNDSPQMPQSQHVIAVEREEGED